VRAGVVKVLIVDDERPARERIAGLLAEDPAQQVEVSEAANGLEALRAIGEQNPDVVLLDIRMPVMDGLETARHIAGLDAPPAVIFTTAYGDHALEAFEAHAVDYLLKPIRADRLHAAVARAGVLSRSRLQAVAGEQDGGPAARTHISAHIRDGIRLVPVPDVRCFQADSKYVTVHWPQGQVLIDEPLKSLEQEFADTFMRVHRNALVARRHIAALETDGQGGHCLRMHGMDDCVSVSRRHLAEVRKLLR